MVYWYECDCCQRTRNAISLGVFPLWLSGMECRVYHLVELSVDPRNDPEQCLGAFLRQVFANHRLTPPGTALSQAACNLATDR